MWFKTKKGINIGRFFKAKWLMRRRRGICVSKAESTLAAKGIEVVDIKDVIRPALVEEPFFPPPEEFPVPEEKPPCYMFTNAFKPIWDLSQCQLITNSLVLDYPESFQEKVVEISDEEKEMFKDIVLQSLLLDAEQVALKKDLNVIKHPGYNPPRVRSLSKLKKIENLYYYMWLALERTIAKKELRHMLHRATSNVTLNHYDKLMHMDHLSNMILCSKKPLKPILNPEEVKQLQGTPLPDIYPLSPFVSVDESTQYNIKEGYAVPGGALAPHTVFVGCPITPFLIRPEAFYGMTMVYAFSFAASYARQKYKGFSGDLEEPVTLNIVHSTEKFFHVGRFQLNTLNCSSSVRNVFWHEPWTALYDKIGYNAATPSIENLNTRIYSLLKALY